MTEIPIIDADRAALQALRSDFLDAFADLEATLIQCLHKLKKQPKEAGGLAQRLRCFKELEASGQLAAKKLETRDRIHDEIVAIVRLRADLVHSRMSVLRTCDGAYGVFINAMDRHEDVPPCRLLSVAQFNSLLRELKRLTNQIASLPNVNPASSPPPPLPGAAGGP